MSAMKNSIKTSAIWITLATIPLNINANFFDQQTTLLKNNTKTLLYKNLEKNGSDSIINGKNIDILTLTSINSRIITDAVSNYFDEEVKAFKISKQAKEKLNQTINAYLSKHSILKIWNDWTVRFIIDDKKAFSQMVKDFTNIIIDDMPFLIKKVAIPLFLWWNNSIQQKLDNLDSTAMNLKENQYKDVIFDYIWWIVKRVVSSTNWKMKIWDYYNSINSYYPNKHYNNIMNQLNNLWLKNQDIKNLKYPFK